MKVIICGGRDYRDSKHLFDWLDKFHQRYRISTVIEGGAKGADMLAAEWAKKNSIELQEFKANWDRDGIRAGFIRNKLMLDQIPDAVIAFPGGNGTENMIFTAQRAGVKVYDGSLDL